MPLRALSRGLSRYRREPVRGAADKMGLPWDAYYVLTKAEARLTNSKIHPNSGAPDYNIKHDHATDFTNVGTNTHAQVDTHIADSTLHFTIPDLNDLGDVNAATPSDNDSLTWDDATGKWIPEAAGVTDHSALSNLNWASAGHTFDADLDIGAYKLTADHVDITDETDGYQINGTKFASNEGTDNVQVGIEAGLKDVGIRNVFVGYRAGYNNDTTGAPNNGDKNVYVGSSAGYGTSGSNKGFDNIAIGYQALYDNTTGVRNMAIGPFALWNNTTGTGNTAIGRSTMAANTEGTGNMAIGYLSLNKNTTGNFNVAVGRSGLHDNLSGSNNVAIGEDAGYKCTGTGNVFIGYKAGYYQVAVSDKLFIDNQSRTSAALDLTNALVYGTFDATVANQIFLVNGVLKSSYGAMLGDGGTTNYTEIETDGTVKFVGAATVWKDINMGAASLSGPPGLQPGLVNYLDEAGADTGIATYGLAVGEGFSGQFEMQHDYKEGSDIIFHIHWQGITAPTGTDKVKFQLTYTVTRTDTTLNATTVIVIETDFDTQYEIKQSDFPAITGTSFTVEDQFVFTLERIAEAQTNTEERLWQQRLESTTKLTPLAQDKF